MKKETKKRLFQKNQIIITALALMIAIAGYLNFAGKEMDPEESSKALSDAAVEEDQLMDLSQEDLEAQELLENGEGPDIFVANEEEADEIKDLAEGSELPAAGTENPSDETKDLAEQVEQSSETPGEAVMTATGVGVVASAKMNRDQVRSKNKETLQEIIDSGTVTEAQRQEAVNGMLEMTEKAEKEVAAETLLQAKGFTDVIVSITDTSVDVVVNQQELTDPQLAQIEDIVKRKTGSAGNNIVISTVGEQQEN